MARILLVEDNERFAGAAEEYLSSREHAVTLARDYAQAIDGLTVPNYSGIITDCFFPEITGSGKTDLGIELVDRMAQSDPHESKMRKGLEALGQYVDLEDPDALKYAKLYLSGIGGDISDSPIFGALRAVAGMDKGLATHTFKQIYEMMYREERTPKDYYGALVKAIGESEANQPLGLLVAEMATELDIPVVLATSTFHHDILTQPVQDYAARNGWALVDCNFGREDEKASPEFWQRALVEIEHGMQSSGV